MTRLSPDPSVIAKELRGRCVIEYRPGTSTAKWSHPPVTRAVPASEWGDDRLSIPPDPELVAQAQALKPIPGACAHTDCARSADMVAECEAQ